MWLEKQNRPMPSPHEKLKITEMGRLSAQAFSAARKQPLCVVLDDIRSLHNVGSVFRTADAFRLERLYLCGITACPPSVEIHKTALGAESTVPWTYRPTALEAVSELREEGYTVLALEQTRASIPLQEVPFEPHRKYALIVGNEVKGVRQEVIDAAHGTVEIPQYGTKHSLNVSVSCGMALWELTRLRLLSGDLL